MTGTALLIGINEYPNSPLRGCVNDVKNMAQLLREKYGMDIDVVRSCLDRRATTQGILDRLEDWAVHATEGKWSIWHQSGHGSTYPRMLETDGRGECICPVDYDGSSDHMITDETLCNILRLKHDDSKLLLVLDTCFSGGMDRGITTKDRQRYYSPPDKRGGKVTSSIVSQLPPRVVILAGASEEQTGADAYIGGKYQGAFTYFLAEALRLDLANNLQRLIDVCTSNLRGNEFSQVPAILGDSSLFGEPFLF